MYEKIKEGHPKKNIFSGKKKTIKQSAKMTLPGVLFTSSHFFICEFENYFCNLMINSFPNKIRVPIKIYGRLHIRKKLVCDKLGII